MLQCNWTFNFLAEYCWRTQRTLRLQSAFTNLGQSDGCFPISESLSKEVMSLPMSPDLETEKLDYIIDTLLASVSKV